MKRPWQVWSVFIACVVGAAAAMVWLTAQAVHTDERRRAAEAETELEQRVSLALWRMDTELAPIIAEEVIRPPAAYRSRPEMAANGPAQSSFGFGQQQQDSQAPNGPARGMQSPATQVPSQVDVPQQALPQLAQQPQAAQQAVQPPPPNGVEPPEYVLLQFEAAPDGRWTSPNGAASANMTRLDNLRRGVQLPQLIAELPNTPLPTVADVGRNFSATKSAKNLAEYNRIANKFQFIAGNETPPEELSQSSANSTDEESTENQQAKPQAKGKMPSTRSVDFEQRGQRYQSAAQQSLLNQQREFGANNINAPNGPPIDADSLFGRGAAADDERVGVSRPVWVGERLLLARRVESNGSLAVQGAWLDWPQLKKRLLAETVDLLPDADLVPAPASGDADPGRMLAGLPVRLVIGPATTVSLAGKLTPTLQWALWMGWGALALATLAAAALLGGVMALSERRAAFVSSVTHELRTPLTTFRMYAEMLARGMVPDAARRQEYLETLQRESERLTHLVENVLAYARLERGRRPQTIERASVGELLERVGPRLVHRAEQADMQCDVEIADKAGAAMIATDLNMVEQILFNLVDNAAKYAASASDRRIHVMAERNGECVKLSVADHGPGFAAGSFGRMKAFGKSAEESAETAPGVGLGLALCRRLAKQLGGRLDAAATPGGGATVTLALPVS